MAGIEGIVLAFFPLAKPTQTAVLAKRMEVFTSTGKKLVRIRLVAGIPDNFVTRRIQQTMQRDREFHYPEV